MAPLKVGLIGAGGIAGAHMPAYREHPDEVRVVAVCDVVEASARRRAAEAGTDRVFTSVEAMLAEADVDAVDVCTIHAAHAENVLAAAAAGKHVLVEKPMGCSFDECRRMVEACEEAGVVFMVGQTRRFDPSYRGVVDIARSGELGPIRAVRLDAMQNGPEGLRRNSWLLDGKLAGGGVVISVAVHQIDLARLCVGEVKRVTATCRTMHEAFRNGAEDYAAVVLEFENGAIGELFATYAGFRQPWSETFMIFGDDGAIHAVPRPGEGAYSGPAFVASRRRSPAIAEFTDMFKGYAPVPPAAEGLPTANAFTNEILHFAECCREGREPISSGRDNLGTMKIVFGIYESSRRGQPVDLEEL